MPSTNPLTSIAEVAEPQGGRDETNNSFRNMKRSKAAEDGGQRITRGGVTDWLGKGIFSPGQEKVTRGGGRWREWGGDRYVCAKGRGLLRHNSGSHE